MSKKDEPSLLDEFRATRFKATRCVVCFEATPDVREVIEDGLRRGMGAVTIRNWLKKRGRWEWSESPIKGHSGHMK